MTGGYEVQLRRPQPSAEVALADVDLETWSDSMQAAGAIARALAPTAFVPKSLRVHMFDEDRKRDVLDVPGTTAAVAAAVLTGKEVGLSPMAALRSIDVIEGTPALRAIALRAIVLRAGHELWVEESTSTRAIIKGIRAGSSREQSSTWTIDRAKVARLAGKPNWQAHPSAMLVARATAEVARLIAPDVLLGLPYIAEELADGDQLDDQAETEAGAAPTPRRTAQRRTRKPNPRLVAPATPAPSEPVEDEPPLDDAEPDAEKPAPDPAPETPDPDPAPPEAMATASQIKAIDRALTKVKIVSPRRRLGAVMQITGRPVPAFDELYGAEAVVVLDELANLDQRLRDQAKAAGPEQPELSEDDRWDEVLAGLDDEQTSP